VRIGTPGGGGFGDPLEREPERVLADVEEGFVSLEAAEREYGVAIVEGKPDTERTAALRALRRGPGRPAARFTLGPHREQLEARWPDGLQSAANAATAPYPTALRDYIRRALLDEIDRRLDAGTPVPAETVPALLAALVHDRRLPLPSTPKGHLE
jgi:N-methylhydantoinase B